MKVAIMQPYFFPYIGYFQLINAVQKFIFYDDVSFIKRGWVNRNNILIGGASHLFTVPVEDASQNSLIKDTKVSDGVKIWQEKFKKTLFYAYKKAPYFEAVNHLIDRVIEENLDSSIGNLAMNSVKACCDYLDLKVEFKVSSTFAKKESYINMADRLIDLTKQLGGQIYVNSYGGVELYTFEYFKQKNLELQFLKPVLVPYKQYSGSFISSLSIIDVLMFNSVQSVRENLLSGELIWKEN